MSKIFELITDGLITIADSYVSPRRYIQPSRNGFKSDREKLRGDVTRVGQNMNKALAAYHGKQPHKSSSN